MKQNRKNIYSAITYMMLAAVIFAGLAWPAGDFNKPATTSSYTNFATEVRDMFADQSKLFSGTSTTHYPVGAIRYNSSTVRLEKYNGSSWDELDVSGIDTLTSLTVGTGGIISTSATNTLGTVSINTMASTATVTSLSADTVDGKNPGSANGLATLGADTLLAQNAPSGFTIGGNTAWHSGNMPIEIGTYTPTLTKNNNLDSNPTLYGAMYLRVGSRVLVTCSVSVDATTAGSFADFYITLPFASALTSNYQLMGTGVYEYGNYRVAQILADVSGDRAQVNFYPESAAAIRMVLQFMYTIV